LMGWHSISFTGATQTFAYYGVVSTVAASAPLLICWTMTRASYWLVSLLLTHFYKSIYFHMVLNYWRMPGPVTPFWQLHHLP
ncbi:hypothetical protein ACQP3C_28645, partial [Escherichia coli]